MAHLFSFICRKVSSGLICLLFMQPLFAQYDFSAVDSKLLQYQKQLGNNAIVLVFKDNKVVYQKALGDCTPTTQAPVAACSQWMTAALVMTFVDEGKLSLDDPVSKYLPIFATYMKSYVTIRQCLTHTTGIQGEKFTLKLGKYQTLAEEVNDFASKREIEAQPSAEFRYSTVGLNIAGRVLEVISKKPFDRLMQDRILRPLGLKNTSFASEKAVNPSTGAVSTAADYLRFLQLILEKGSYAGKRILSEASIAEMQLPRTTTVMMKTTPKAGEGMLYGYGEWIQEADAQGKTTVATSPGISGTWPLVDNRQQYACIIFVKNAQTEQPKTLYLEIKSAIDNAIGASK